MKQYVVDAFTSAVFGGNPAAVCILDAWRPDELLSAIAVENNLSETAFAVKEGAGYRLRWFTPGGEIDLCGHATLATAYVILNFCEPERKSVDFSTLSGKLTVTRRGDLYELDLPAFALRPTPVTDAMERALGARPRAAFLSRDLLCVFDAADTVRQMAPDLSRVAELEGLLCHVTAPGEETDCVSRSFAPKLSIPEDPVCGSGQCHIIPYWADRLGRREGLIAYQASRRGGALHCRLDGGRVFLAGPAALYAEAELFV